MVLQDEAQKAEEVWFGARAGRRLALLTCCRLATSLHVMYVRCAIHSIHSPTKAKDLKHLKAESSFNRLYL